MFKRICQECKKILRYFSRGALNNAIKRKTLCRSCSCMGEKNHFYGRKHSGETKKKISEFRKGKYIGKNNPNYGRPLSEEQKRNLSISMKGRYAGENNPNYGKHHSKETKKKISESRRKYVGEKHPMYGKHHSEETRKKSSESHKGLLAGEKHPNYGKHPSEKTRKKIRLARIGQIEQNKNNGNQIHPSYNPHSIPILEQKARDLGVIDLQHAENGGEFYLKELGYWADGYSKEKNIWFEYNERAHNRRKEKDERRKQEIINFLHCKFIEIFENFI